jgi:Flp pilus assembly pilin Flp
MTRLTARWRNFIVRADSGATAIEYSLIAGAMGLALILGMPYIKSGVYSGYVEVANAFSFFN